VEANFENGVLDIPLPKSEKTRSKKIKIKIGIRPPLSDDPNASVPIIPNIRITALLSSKSSAYRFSKNNLPA
jgi:hypothetical protein